MRKEVDRQLPEAREEARQPDDLQLDGEEQEYFLELLMRRASPERPKVGQPAESVENPRNKAVSDRGQEKRRSKKEKKALKKARQRKRPASKGKREGRQAQPTTQ
jgi:hypothetical protein